jgi:hypothetical protein
MAIFSLSKGKKAKAMTLAFCLLKEYLRLQTKKLKGLMLLVLKVDDKCQKKGGYSL